MEADLIKKFAAAKMDNSNLSARLKALEEDHISVERVEELEQDHVTIERFKTLEDTVSSKDLLKEQLEQAQQNTLKMFREEFNQEEWNERFEAMDKVIEEASEQARKVNANFENTASKESTEALRLKLNTLTKRLDELEDEKNQENNRLDEIRLKMTNYPTQVMQMQIDVELRTNELKLSCEKQLQDYSREYEESISKIRDYVSQTLKNFKEEQDRTHLDNNELKSFDMMEKLFKLT